MTCAPVRRQSTFIIMWLVWLGELDQLNSAWGQPSHRYSTKSYGHRRSAVRRVQD